MARCGVLRFQLRRAFGSKALPYVFLFSFGAMVVCHVQACLTFWGHDVAEVPSAAVAWVGNDGLILTSPFSYFVNYLMLPLASSVFGDSFCADVKGGLASNVASRSSLRGYVLSGVLAAFASAFCVMAAALFAFQLLAYLAFPSSSGPDAYQVMGLFTAEAGSLDQLSLGLFGHLRAGNRVLCNGIYSFYAALWAGAAAVASYAISILCDKNRLVAIGVPALVFVVANMVLPQELAPVALMGSILGDSGLVAYSSAVFVLEPLVVLAALFLAVAFAVRLKKDVLL